jgi:hypothetical protein
VNAILLNSDNEVIQIKYDVPFLLEGEIASDTAKMGQIMQPDGTFIDKPVVEDNAITMDDKINYIFYNLLGQPEKAGEVLVNKTF